MAMLQNNLRPLLTTGACAVAYLGVCSAIGKYRLLPRKLSRKLMHMGTGPIYMLCWPLYSSGPASPWLCAAVPLLASLHFGLVGTGLIRDPSLVAAVTRSGDRRELLHGPMLYGVVHSAVAALLWRRSPGAIIALSVLCGGDGLAEVVGSSVSSRRLPHSQQKSLAGSLACFAGGLAFSLPLLLHFRALGLLQPLPGMQALSGSRLLAGAALCSGVGALVESLPLADLDNVAVPLAVAATARLFFGF